jgi:hypothetical protein
VENKGTTRSNVYPKVLREGRDLKMLLLQKKKNTSKEGGDVYLASSRRNIEHEARLVDSGASYHMTRKIQVEHHGWKDWNTQWCSSHPMFGHKFNLSKKNGQCMGKNNV